MAGRDRKGFSKASELRRGAGDCWRKQAHKSPKQGIGAPQRVAHSPHAHRDWERLPKDNDFPWQQQPDGRNGECYHESDLEFCFPALRLAGKGGEEP